MGKTLTLLSTLLLLLSLAGCGGELPSEPDDTLNIVATTYPVYLFATAVTQGAEGVEVELMVNQDVSCLHDYTLTVTDMKLLEQADVLIINGAGLEEFLSDALATSKAAVIDCSQDIDLRESMGHEGHDHETEYDPHIWMCEETALVMLDNICDGLSQLDPGNLDLYVDNLNSAARALPEDPLENVELACPYLITFHDGFQYFAHDNRLTLLKAIEEEEGAEASSADIKEIIQLIEEYHIPAIFTEVNGSQSTAQAIARETGVAVIPLNMIMSGEGRGIQPYVEGMEENYAAIARGLGGG